MKEAIVQLKYYKQKIVMDPCYKIPQSVFRLRQAQFKVLRYSNREVKFNF